jgi:hypothetical protein
MERSKTMTYHEYSEVLRQARALAHHWAESWANDKLLDAQVAYNESIAKREECETLNKPISEYECFSLFNARVFDAKTVLEIDFAKRRFEVDVEEIIHKDYSIIDF